MAFKSTRRLVTVSALIGILFFSCKKGADDPSMSFISRKSRLCGEWRCETGALEYANQISSDKYSISGTKFTNSGYQGTASVNFTFEKDGTCSSSIVMAGFVNKWHGTWNFTKGVGEHKNKSQVIIHLLDFNDGSKTYYYGGNDQRLTFDLIELRNKKIHMKMQDKTTFPNGTWYSELQDWVLVPKK